MKKNVVGMVFTILALVFILVGLVGSWYNTHMEMHMDSSDPFNSFFTDRESDQDIYLTRVDSTMKRGDDDPVTQSMSISEMREELEGAGSAVVGGTFDFLDTISNTFIITIVAVIFAIIAMVFAIISVIKPKLQMIGGILSILVFVFALLAPIIFMAGFSSYLEAQTSTFDASAETADIGFWFSRSEGGNEMSMGPGYAWYLMIIAAVFGLIGGLILFIKQKQAMPIPTVPMQPQTPPVSPPIQ